MPTREQVLRLLERGLDYEAAGRTLGVPAGQAYLIATGLPADGDGTLTPDERRRPGVLAGSGQQLVGPEAENPTGRDSVREWLRRRALADPQMRRAAQQRESSAE